ncbi:MAG: hypothetical protein LRY27_00440 [Chitinophagales bacterium]|nr:hypothetical protein [Chitinophagales bacterium]
MPDEDKEISNSEIERLKEIDYYGIYSFSVQSNKYSSDFGGFYGKGTISFMFDTIEVKQDSLGYIYKQSDYFKEYFGATKSFQSL